MVFILLMNFIAFYFCPQFKSEQGNGTLMISTGDRRCVMKARWFIAARVKPSSTAARMERKIATASQWLCQGVFLNVSNNNASKFNNNNTKF